MAKKEKIEVASVDETDESSGTIVEGAKEVVSDDSDADFDEFGDDEEEVEEDTGEDF